MAQSIILYAAPVWRSVLNFQCSDTILNTLNRNLAIGIYRGYRTIPTATAEVLASLAPIELLIKEKLITSEKSEAERKAAKSLTAEISQERWGESEGNTWLRKMIPNFTSWISRGRV